MDKRQALDLATFLSFLVSRLSYGAGIVLGAFTTVTVIYFTLNQWAGASLTDLLSLYYYYAIAVIMLVIAVIMSYVRNKLYNRFIEAE